MASGTARRISADESAVVPVGVSSAPGCWGARRAAKGRRRVVSPRSGPLDRARPGVVSWLTAPPTAPAVSSRRARASARARRHPPGQDGRVSPGAALGRRPRLLLVVLLVHVDGPDVVAGAVHDVVDRQQRRVHRVVLVVVLVHAVAAHGVHVGPRRPSSAGSSPPRRGTCRRTPDTPWACAPRTRARP